MKDLNPRLVTLLMASPMDSQYGKFISMLWCKVTGTAFDEDALIAQVFHDGGHDFKRISKTQLSELLHGRYVGEWDSLGFAFSETLAVYAAGNQMGEVLDAKQVVAWVFAAIVVSEAVMAGTLELQYQFASFLDVFVSIRKYLTTEEAIFLLRSVLREAAQ